MDLIADPIPDQAVRSLRRMAAASVLAAALVAAAGFGSWLVAAATAAPGPLRIDVHIRFSRYVPASVTVPAGRAIEFILHNDDPIDHEWIVADPSTHAAHRTGTEMHHGARPTEQSLRPGETLTTTVTFASPGALQVICHLPGHEGYGMVGTIVVTAGGH